MRIPKNVIVGGHLWKVILVPENKIEDPDTVAHCRYPQRIITLLDNRTDEIMWMDFLHELRHAFQFEMGYTQIFQSQMAEIDADNFSSFIISLQKQKIL